MSASIDSIIDLVLFERGYTGTEGTSVAILAALCAAGYVVERDWQDISTAPRDGTAIDLWYRPYTGTARRLTEMWWVKDMGWRNGDRSCVIAPNYAGRITHWRPLPAPPT